MNTEKQKMLSGELYQAFGEELFKERQAAKRLVYKFNSLHPDELELRNQIAKEILGKTEGSFLIEPPFRCDYGYNIEIGENFYSNYNCIILDCAKVNIGKNVLFGPNVSIFTAGHPVDTALRVEGFEYALPINIGDNVWIGGNVVINPGVEIGDNSIIGAGSVVTKNIPANVVAFGNPCKIYKSVEKKQ